MSLDRNVRDCSNILHRLLQCPRVADNRPKVSEFTMNSTKGPSKRYVTQKGVGVSDFPEKSVKKIVRFNIIRGLFPEKKCNT